MSAEAQSRSPGLSGAPGAGAAPTGNRSPQASHGPQMSGLIATFLPLHSHALLAIGLYEEILIYMHS